MAKPKLTLEQQYNKEIKRIENLIKNAEDIGFAWVKTPIPPKPKRITEASIQKLKKITSQNIFKSAVYNDPISHAQFTGEQGQTIIKYRQTTQKDKSINNGLRIPQPKTAPKPKQIKKASKGTPAKKSVIVGQRLSDILQQINEALLSYNPPAHWSIAMASARMNTVQGLSQMITSLINLEHGAQAMEEAVKRVEEKSDRVGTLLDIIFYDSDQFYVDQAVNELISIIFGGALTVQQNEVLTDIREDMQGFEVI